jgi:LysM repeat protein
MLMAANPKLKTRLMKIGQRVVVPTGGVPSTKVARRMSEPVVAAGTSTSAFHRVKRGETISEIADEFGVTQRELQSWNGLDSRGRIRIGQRLRGENPRGAAGRNAEGPGETLWRFGPGPQESEWVG